MFFSPLLDGSDRCREESDEHETEMGSQSQADSATAASNVDSSDEERNRPKRPLDAVSFGEAARRVAKRFIDDVDFGEAARKMRSPGAPPIGGRGGVGGGVGVSAARGQRPGTGRGGWVQYPRRLVSELTSAIISSWGSFRSQSSILFISKLSLNHRTCQHFIKDY